MTFIPDRDDAGRAVTSVGGVRNPDGMRARIFGSHYNVMPKGVITDVDWKIPQLSFGGSNKQAYFDGVEYYAKNAEIGDKVKFQVVDVDNILGYGANYVIEEFADVYVMPDAPIHFTLYKAKLVANLYIRIKYNSIGSVNNIDFACNLMRHLASKENV